MHAKKIAYAKAKILRVDTGGLQYVDDEGTTCTIDFHVCHENVLKELRSPGWVQVKKSETIYVGFRDSTANPPQFTFPTDPETCFRYPLPKPAVAAPGEKFLRGNPEDLRDFFEFEVRLAQAGVRTLDMS